jgi:nucleoside-diphosphate-sugar epimerase
VRVLVVGCGDLGTEAALRFVAAGHEVVGLRRRTERLPDPIVPLAADLTQPLPPLPGDLEVVVYCPTAGERTAGAYRAVYLEGLQRVLEGLERAGADPRHVLNVSSTAVYGVTDGSWVDEDTPAEPSSPTGEILLAAERALAAGPSPATSLRLAGIYGPGRTRLVEQVRQGAARLVPHPAHTNRIHRDDAAAAIVHLLTRAERPAACYVGVDHAPVDANEVRRFLAAELGLPDPPVDPEAERRSRGGDKRCRNGRLVATGFTFTYPTYREGYRAVLAGEGVRHP